jgi:hypothetical protein
MGNRQNLLPTRNQKTTGLIKLLPLSRSQSDDFTEKKFARLKNGQVDFHGGADTYHSSIHKSLLHYFSWIVIG